MQALHIIDNVVFIFTAGLTVYFFYRAANRSTPVLTIIFSWLALQAIISALGFYEKTDTMPPRLLLLPLPPVICILLAFLLPAGRRFTDSLNPAILTLLHSVRILVELVLYGLFLDKQVPVIMTFAGGNLDILAGVTAPLVYYFGFIKKRLPVSVMIAWNLLCLALLFRIVFRALFSVPSPLEKFGFEQPNIAILHFPYAWIPAVIVPIVLYAHLATIRQLAKKAW